MEPSVAIDKLVGLGSADEIAKFLAAENVQGKLGSPSQCPIANWVKRECDVIQFSINETEYYINYGEIAHDVPCVVHQFIDSFDSEFYPELDEDEDSY